MRYRVTQTLLCAALLLGLPGLTRGQIVNGSFEIPAIGAAGVSNILVGGEPPGFGWTVTAGTVEVLGQLNAFLPGPAFNGILFLDLNGTSPGTISQAFPTTAGVTYQLNFAYGNNYVWTNVGSPALATVRVFDTGSASDLIAPLPISHGNSTAVNLNWVSSSTTFTATSASTTLRFTSNSPGAGGIILDGVSVTVPAPPNTLFGITFSANQLLTINTTTGAGTLVGVVGPAPTRPFGVAFRGTKLYSYTENAPRDVRELDPATGAVLTTINIGAPATSEGDVVFRSDGIGFLTHAGIFGSYQLYSFDITVPSSTPIGPNLPVPIDGLAFNSAGVLYALEQDGTKLHTLNTTTGALTLVGNTGIAPKVLPLGGLAFDSSDKLYATSCSGGAASNLYSINTATGLATLIGPIGFNEVCGLRFSIGGPPPPVPPPTPTPGSGGPRGADEGDYPRSSGPPMSSPFGQGEGGFGFGLNLRAEWSPSRRPLLLGPFRDVSGGELRYRVFNVSYRDTMPTAEPISPEPRGTIFLFALAGLAVSLIAFLAVKYRPT